MSLDHTLLMKHAPPGLTLEGEVRKLSSVSPERRSQALARLEFVTAYFDRPSKKTEFVEAAAERLGLGRRQAFVLIKGYKKHGIARLIRGYRLNHRASLRRHGLQPEIAEQTLQQLARQVPTPQVKSIYEAIVVACATEEVDPPSQSTVHRRFNFLLQTPDENPSSPYVEPIKRTRKRKRKSKRASSTRLRALRRELKEAEALVARIKRKIEREALKSKLQ